MGFALKQVSPEIYSSVILALLIYEPTSPELQQFLDGILDECNEN